MKILARIGHKLSIRRMIDRFDPYQFAYQCGDVGLYMLDELKLRLRRTDDQYFTGAFKRLCDTVVIVLILRCTAIPQSSNSGVHLMVWVVWLDDGLFNIIRTNVDHMSFHMIDPDEDMIVRHGELLAASELSGRTPIRVSYSMPHARRRIMLSSRKVEYA